MMRFGSWILLLIAFFLGLVSAFAVRFATFDAKPVEVVDRGPTVKILVAQKEIPIGAEIMAEDVAFENVPISEIPSFATTNFMQIYRRRPAYPIPTGCPICEDLLIPAQEEQTETVKYLPAGSQIVSLEVEQVRVGDSVSELEIPISNLLAVGDRIDIRVVPRQEAMGEYIQRKNQVLRAFSGKNGAPEPGETILENVGIHGIMSKKAESGGKQIQTLSLLLENGQAEQLTHAAREGRLRIIPHRPKEENQTNQQASTETSDETSSLQTEVSSEISRDLRQISQYGADQPENSNVRRNRIRSLDRDARIRPVFEEGAKPIASAASTTSNGLEIVSDKSMEPAVERRPDRNGAHVSFVTPKSVLKDQAFGTETENRPATAIVPRPVENNVKQSSTMFRSRSRVVEIGLSQMDSATATVETLSPGLSSGEDYSPFSTESRLFEKAEPADESENPPQPLPLRTRLQWR